MERVIRMRLNWIQLFLYPLRLRQTQVHITVSSPIPVAGPSGPSLQSLSLWLRPSGY